MKPEIRQLLSEMLRYKKHDKTSNYIHLKEAITIMEGKEEIFHLISHLTNWLDPLLSKVLDLDPEQLNLRGNEGLDYSILIKNMHKFFTLCPKLNEIFLLADNIIYFSPTLTKQDKKEIQTYIDKNTTRVANSYYIRADYFKDDENNI